MSKFQGGLTNSELAAEFAKKLPGVTPTERELSAFALGIKVGEALPREANDDDARDAARWRAIEWRWGSGTVTLDCDDKGFFRMQVEHAEANDEYITALDPEGVLAKAITAEEASSREYVKQP